ncbi:MAG: RagB/SusD family nutrient uptake outer membrane protein [Chitinophagaceae bacterium]|nr:RagB/SusD family nutrient uptake outer membrane protein [Chitinophagaceae bacterium]
MKKLTVYIKIFILLTGYMTMGACNKDILNYADPNSKNTDTYFNTPDEIESGAIAVYSSFFHNSAFAWQLPEVFDGLANEYDGRPPSANEPEIVAIWRYEHNNATTPIRSYWRLLYRMVLRANLVLYKAGQYQDANGANEKVSHAMGDAYFLRGWAYSQLAFHWGSVPLRTDYIIEGNGDLPRAQATEIWTQAESDLKNAQSLLPDSWSDDFLGRATKGAASGFLGKLYLYNQKYSEADAEFEKMKGKYSLLPGNRWDDNFGETNENNEESVFEIQFFHYPGTNVFYMFGDPETSSNPGRQNAHAQLYSWTDWANWAFQPRRVTDFQYNDEDGHAFTDPRAALTFYGGTIGDQTWCDHCPEGVKAYDFATYGYWYRKFTNKEYKPSENGVETGNNIRLMRYADVLLMRAECQIKMGNIGTGIDYINEVRERIGAFPYEDTYTPDQAFELLKRERQLEFMGEQIRYNDLKRWGILKETMNVELQALFGAPNVQDKHNFFPIPQIELDTNRDFGPVDNNWN